MSLGANIYYLKEKGVGLTDTAPTLIGEVKEFSLSLNRIFWAILAYSESIHGAVPELIF